MSKKSRKFDRNRKSANNAAYKGQSRHDINKRKRARREDIKQDKKQRRIGAGRIKPRGTARRIRRAKRFGNKEVVNVSQASA